MKTLRLLLGLVVSATFFSAYLHAADLSDTQKKLQSDIKLLADDKMQGRGVGTEGLNQAAEYVRKSFADAGLDVTSVDGGAFQKFNLVTGGKLGDNNSLKFVGPDKKEINLEINNEYNLCSFGGSGKISGDIVFGGYGIDAKGLYQDFKDIDVKGKIVIIMRRTPQQENKKSKFASQHGISQHAGLRTKVSVCSTAGAAAILFVNDPHGVHSEAESAVDVANNQAIKLTRALLKLKEGTETYAAAKKRLETALKNVNKAHGDAHSGATDSLMKFGYGGWGKSGAIPIAHISVAKCDELLKATLKKSLADLEAEIDTDLKPRSVVLKGWRAEGVSGVTQVRTEVKNVVGVLEGEGPLADETIVVGAHYDHVGLGGQGSLAPGSKEVHNGADDNASGTVTLLEVARRLAGRKTKLSRRIVFIAFTAEELGLIGSAKYVAQPIFPLDKTVAMYNMDMVGRLTDNKLTIFGVGTSPNYKDEVTKFSEGRNFKLTLKPEGFGPSDQSSFYAKKIPVLHFFTGTHKDYHRPGDDWEKINVEGMDRIAGLVEDVVVNTSETKERPKYLEVKRRAQVARSGSRPYFGSIPDFGTEEKGYALSGVAAGSPAEKGGLKGGDRIIAMGKNKINDLSDFDLALRKFKAGQEVELTVVRAKKEIKLKVTLAKPR
jgi:hypothetical protein